MKPMTQDIEPARSDPTPPPQATPPMPATAQRSPRWTWRRLAVLFLVVTVATGSTAVWTNALGAGERFERLVHRIDLIIDPPPRRPTVATVVVTPRPSPMVTTAAIPRVDGPTRPAPSPSVAPDPTPAPQPVRAPVDVTIVADHQAVFASQITTEWCAVAGTQMVLTILGLGNNSPEFQNELAGRIDEWESWEDSHDGGWGPGAVAQALAAYGATDYQVRAYDSHTHALRDMAIALSTTGKPVVIFPWWGAHTWVMTGYRADADPVVFPDATITGAYILDPWYPRFSTIWGQSDPPGNFEDLAELERNWPTGTPGGFGPGWSRPEGAYPERDGRYVVLVPTTP